MYGSSHATDLPQSRTHLSSLKFRPTHPIVDHQENHLIEQLPWELQERLLKSCERFSLVPTAKLVSCGDVLTHAYFPISGAIALVIDGDGRPPFEVGALGRESMLGSELLLGTVQSPWRAVVQSAGTCWRISVDGLRQAMADMPSLRASLQQNFIVQVHQRQALASAAAAPMRRERQRFLKRYKPPNEGARDQGVASALAMHTALLFLRISAVGFPAKTSIGTAVVEQQR